MKVVLKKEKDGRVMISIASYICTMQQEEWDSLLMLLKLADNSTEFSGTWERKEK